MSRPHLAPSYKYTLFAIPGVRLPSQIPDLLALGNGLHFSTGLPMEVPDRWKTWLGSLRFREVDEAGFYLLAVAPSLEPSVLNGENQSLTSTVYDLYIGVMVSVPYLSHQRITALTGANTGEGADVRQVWDYSRTYYTLGSPRTQITVGRLKQAAQFASALASIKRTDGAVRLARIIRTFMAGVQAYEMDVRVHQFVRCTEGFVHPPFQSAKRTFAHRTQQLIEGNFDTVLGELYTIRSTTEHLLGPMKAITAPTERERRLLLLQRAVQAETLARYCMWNFLRSPHLWEYFVSDDSIEKFWNLPERQRRALWGSRLDLAGATREFEPTALEDRDLFSLEELARAKQSTDLSTPSPETSPE